MIRLTFFYFSFIHVSIYTFAVLERFLQRWALDPELGELERYDLSNFDDWIERRQHPGRIQSQNRRELCSTYQGQLSYRRVVVV